MKLGSFRRIYKQDFPQDQQNLAEQLGTTMNDAFDQLFDALNNNISFKDNMQCTIAEFTVTVDSGGVPKQTTSIKLNSKQTSVEGVFVIGAVGANDPTILPNTGVFVSAVKSGNFLSIQNIKGIAPNTTFKIKIIAVS